ncbi:ParB/RepB/Spo0J family partition protein [Streptosporangium canum]|uniref:ParB/RepB/Spo0J family partition protein n=1 Tax=Streptosporangium canum TaxID=324952 RepID=UPI0036816EDC
MVELDKIAPNPRNRRDLGDLRELTESIKEIGILSEPTLANRDAYLEAYPDAAEEVGTATHVLIFGERRYAASKLAGLTAIPVKVRDDLAKNGRDIPVMIMENLHRKPPTPLEEAHLFQILRDRGLTEREIAPQVAKSQSHVNKRLQLLRLPQVIQDAIELNKIPVIDGLTLGSLKDKALILAAWEEVRAQGAKVSDVVERFQQRAQVDGRREEAVARAQQEGLKVIDASVTQSNGTLLHHLSTSEQIEAARERGDLAASFDASGHFVYVSRSTPKAPSQGGAVPQSNGRPGEGAVRGATAPVAAPLSATSSSAQGSSPLLEVASEKPDHGVDADWQQAVKHRAEACVSLVQHDLDPTKAVLSIAYALVSLDADARALNLARTWLCQAGVGPAVDDDRAYAATALDGPDHEFAVRLAYAMALAKDELRTRACGARWDDSAIKHIQHLTEATGYQPTEWEQARIAAATADAV